MSVETYCNFKLTCSQTCDSWSFEYTWAIKSFANLVELLKEIQLSTSLCTALSVVLGETH